MGCSSSKPSPQPLHYPSLAPLPFHPLPHHPVPTRPTAEQEIYNRVAHFQRKPEPARRPPTRQANAKPAASAPARPKAHAKPTPKQKPQQKQTKPHQFAPLSEIGRAPRPTQSKPKPHAQPPVRAPAARKPAAAKPQRAYEFRPLNEIGAPRARPAKKDLKKKHGYALYPAPQRGDYR